ncbi:MAG TPA: UdgX family uracil-DNA binding protein [Steroidobacteraceae bacterium]|nr:UdgX family uracil-DNA binding protein [Steroidobacteraceae bacterium]
MVVRPARPSQMVREAPGSTEKVAAPLASQIDRCRRCDLWRRATHGVTGEGPSPAQMMLVGEQPGDVEDRAGRPFVGPAGRVLDQLLVEAGLERGAVYVTNAVKHFKWEPRGKRRLHRRPTTVEIDACQVWLEQEILAVKPRILVALGATAARALLHKVVTIESARRHVLGHPSGAHIFVTYHPSAVLRAEEGAKQTEGLVASRSEACRRGSGGFPAIVRKDIAGPGFASGSDLGKELKEAPTHGPH